MKRLLLLMLFPVLAFAQTTKPPVATGSQDNVARDSIVTHRRNIDSLFQKVGVDNATRDSITVHRSNLNLKLDKADTASLSARINLKQAAGTYLVPSDTSSLTARFAAKQAAGTYLVPSDTSSLTARFAAKQAAGTYLIPSDTSSLTARFNAKQAAGTYLIPSDTSSLTARFAAKQAAGTYLVPSDTSSLTARFSNTKVADSLTSGTLPIARMPNSGVGAGSYTYPYSVTVDQYGRVTAATTGNKPAFGDTLMTKYADSTGLASASRAAMVWNSTLNKWQVQQAVKIGTTSGSIPSMASSDSLGAFAKETQVYKAPMTAVTTGDNTSTMGRLSTFSGASSSTLWYGHLAKAADGTLVYGYAYGGTQLRTRTSTDNGVTWSTFASEIDAPSGHLFNGATFGITPSGAWVFLSSDDTTVFSGIYVKALKIKSYRSTNSGSTWTVTDSIATTMGIDMTSGIASFSNGDLIAAYGEGAWSYRHLDTLYGSPANHDTSYIRVIKSTDDGVTWGTPIVAHAHHDSVYQLNEPFLDEPAIAVDANDNAVIICRNPDYGTSQLVSSDAGETWTFKGVIGQTNCGPGVYSSNSTPDLLTVNDSTFMAVVGYRLNMDGPGTDAGKIGYFHILTGTWNEIQDATFGWSTFYPPTPVYYGDAGAHRAVVTDDSALAMVQLQGGYSYRLTPAEIAKARASWMLSHKQSMQYRPIQTYNFADRIILSNTDFATLYAFNILTPPQYDSIATSAIGAIPVIGFSAFFDDAGGADTAWVKLSDANDITMPSNADSLYYRYVDGTTYSSEFRWQTWFPTKLRNAAGTSVLGQFEKQIAPAYLKAKSSDSSILNSIEVHMGYIYK